MKTIQPRRISISRRTRTGVAFATLLATTAIVGIGTIAGTSPVDAAPALPPAIDITATTSSFSMSSPAYQSGWAKVVLTNNDAGPHQASLIKLAQDTTAKDFLKQFAEIGTQALANTVSSGGPAIAFPGQSSSVTVDLSPGTYVAMDLVPGVDGKPRATKGFVTSFDVKKPLAGVPSKRPKAVATVQLHDFLFKGQIKLKRGTTLAVRNDGNQPHELVMFGLAPGKSAQDVIDYVTSPSPSGPPPFVSAAGIAGIAPHATGYLGVEGKPGAYVFLCFLPDLAGKGEPHFLKGMVAVGEVTA